MSYKDGKWARQIVELQKDDGTWGTCFHTLSQPVKDKPLTIEQALRRLWVLGFTKDDPPIRKVLDYMTACLRGERKMDDTWEKTHNWPLYTKLMLSTWVKLFDPGNELALGFARRWARVIEAAFASGGYDQDDYTKAYVSEFSSNPRGSRETDVIHFYNVLLFEGVLPTQTENLWIEKVLSHPDGVYYLNSKKQLNIVPETLASKEASRWLGALELLTGYSCAREKLKFASDWLNTRMDEGGRWDFGSEARDGIYFPLSDSWRKVEDRKGDCTHRVKLFLEKLDK